MILIKDKLRAFERFAGILVQGRRHGFIAVFDI